ncbi:hypothetical protein PPACK8108_LOCUS24296 [Phakopsora pachyrhizi]|uniref:Uncharacterized protein n=1 Tax=Phakopsora pachyrhizi TaxID=170000 RepID=A0AAV0BSJ6_PHAPC|nr:hypothetical protein PPACK8108_LOCUS24296 [Phakopsora pachyrhizi]
MKSFRKFQDGAAEEIIWDLYAYNCQLIHKTLILLDVGLHVTFKFISDELSVKHLRRWAELHRHTQSQEGKQELVQGNTTAHEVADTKEARPTVGKKHEQSMGILSGLLTGHREINEEAQKNQLLWIEVMEK